MTASERGVLFTIALFAAVIVTVNTAAVARAPGHPKKPSAQSTPITLQLGDYVIVNGVTYQVVNQPTLIPATAPTPPIPPVPGNVTFSGYRDGNRNPTSITSPGQFLYIQGSGFGAQTGTLTMNAQSPTVVKWQDKEVEVVVPNLVSGPVTLILNGTTSGYPLSCTGGVTPPIPPIPPVPGAQSLTVTGFRDATGRLSWTFQPGSIVFIEGVGFGTTQGSVQIGSKLVPVLLWTPGEIQITCPNLDTGSQTLTVLLTVMTPDHKAWSTMKAFTVAAPGVVGR